MFTNSIKKSFGMKIVASLSVIVIVSFAVFNALLMVHETREIRNSLVNEGKIITSLVAGNIKTWVFAENSELIQEVVHGVMSQRNIRSVTILNTEGTVLLEEQKESADKENGGVNHLQEDVSGYRTIAQIAVRERDEVFEFVAPVVIGSDGDPEASLFFDLSSREQKQQTIGYVRIAMGKERLRQEVLAILFRNASIMLLFLVLSTVMIFLSVRRFTKPLTYLTSAVKSMGKGEPIHGIPVESSDEIGRLTRAFNTMTENLHVRDEEKRSLEERLRHAQKMEALGTLARGIAHDFNNILSTIRGSVYLVDKKLPQGDPLRHYTEQVQNSIMKAKQLINGLMSFSRVREVHYRVINLNVLIEKLRSFLAGIAGEDVSITYALCEHPLLVHADPLQMEQVLLNLCSNARDAMPYGGCMTISTGMTNSGAHAFSADRRSGEIRYAFLSVADTGKGIDEETKERIFEPFFTTKEVGKGTGLGLSIVFGIVEQHRGFIEVLTGEQGGSRFVIYIPLCRESEHNGEHIAEGVMTGEM